MLRRVESAAPDMAKKVRQRLRGFSDFAVDDGLIAVNPIAARAAGKGASTRRICRPSRAERESGTYFALPTRPRSVVA